MTITGTKYGWKSWADDMRWELWGPWYERIAERLRLDREADVEAARAIDRLLPPPYLPGLAGLIRGKECIVFGAGPSLDADLGRLEQAGHLNKVLITADGATSAVLRYRAPEVIVTDLDGEIDGQLKAWQQGSWVVVHAHGDNVPQVHEIVPKLKERVIGTTQVKPFGKLFNFGGFTDGDRAAFMAYELGASKIYLAGMDFTRIGTNSGRKNIERKMEKLRVCKELLGWLSEELEAPIVV